MKRTTWRMIALMLSMAFALSVFSGCGDKVEEQSDGESVSQEESKEETGKTVAEVTPDFLEKVAEMKEVNEDSTGWLQVPGTSIEDVVLHKPDDDKNLHYLRIDIHGNYDFDGVYYADFTSEFGDGSREQLGVNTTIYGHAMTDDPEAEKYDLKFAPLHEFRDPEFAKQTPYLFFSTGKENMAFEVIAVFTANVWNPEMRYNQNLPAADYVKLLKEDILPRSLYDYDVDVSEEDKFLTLSTCIYNLPDGTELPSSSSIRYAVIGRLVPADEALKETAEFTENKDLIVDPHTYEWTGESASQSDSESESESADAA